MAGRSSVDFVKEIDRIEQAGASVPTKYRSKEFLEAVEVAGFTTLKAYVKELLFTPLAGLGVPSDFELFFDGITAGDVNKSPRSGMLAVGIKLSDPRTGEPTVVFLGAPETGPGFEKEFYDSGIVCFSLLNPVSM